MLKKKIGTKDFKIKIPERDIQKSVLAYLNHLKKIYFFRSGNGAIRTELGNFFRTGRPGNPDIVVCYKGIFVGLEIKTKTGKQSPSQEKTEQEIINAGGKYFIIRSIDDVINALESL
jgi:hypothetical protein